jgi:3-oxoadipate enol-lactonase
MRTKANGITFSYEIEGPDGAPFIMFSNSLATDLTMWDPPGRRLQGRLPHPAL